MNPPFGPSLSKPFDKLRANGLAKPCRGSPGYVAVAAAVIMADTAALAAVLIPMMRKAGYDVNRSCGLIACGGVRLMWPLQTMTR